MENRVYFIKVVRCKGPIYTGQFIGVISTEEEIFSGYGRTTKEAAENALSCVRCPAREVELYESDEWWV